MSDSFNPYSEWLGIPPGDLSPDYYALLGLTRGEGAPEAIIQAADRRMMAIRKIRPGEHAPQWAALLDQIREAKACLLDPRQRAKYDVALAESIVPALSLGAASEPAEPSHPDDGGSTTLHGIEAAPQPTISRPVVPAKRSRQWGSTLTGFLAGVVVIVAGYVAWEKRGEIAARLGWEENLQQWGLAEDVDPFAEPLPGGKDSLPSSRAPRQKRHPAPPADKCSSPKPRAAKTPAPPRTAQREPGPRSPTPPAPGNADSRGRQFADLLQRASAETPRVDPKQQQIFRSELMAARKAMATRDLGGAKRHLQSARENVQTDEETTEFLRVEALVRYSEEFWKGIRESLARLPSGLVLDLETDQKAAVVEAGPDRLILHAGQTFHWGLNDIPSHVLLAIAKQGFQQDATTKVIIGTFLVVDHRGHRQRGRAMWEQAARDGAAVAHLIPELDVDYGFASNSANGSAPNPSRSPTLPDVPAAGRPQPPVKSVATLRQAARNARGFAEKRQVVVDALLAARQAAEAKRLGESRELAELALAVARDTNNAPLMRGAASALRQIEVMQQRK